ncbi:excisionase [Subtercola boreus]|uniref:Excisionase n=1 Tax=Subtercola boreus TaxID=120213 RepID=A0A3E0W4V6_9MICO|nr:helix-turn-helix domain-containing protein [Subtercola boreus]RFA16573.1 excisionase [Subtercola boreus]
MSITHLTITPEDVRTSTSESGLRPAWLEEVAAYVQQAAADGATVTLTSKQRMLTPEQVADAMGVSRSTISRKIKAGEIQAVKVGNRNRVPYEEFERFWGKTMGAMGSAPTAAVLASPHSS